MSLPPVAWAIARGVCSHEVGPYRRCVWAARGSHRVGLEQDEDEDEDYNGRDQDQAAGPPRVLGRPQVRSSFLSCFLLVAWAGRGITF